MKNLPPWAWLVIAVLYLLSPVDACPDVPVLGWWDDVLFCWWCWEKYKKETKGPEDQRPLPPPLPATWKQGEVEEPTLVYPIEQERLPAA